MSDQQRSARIDADVQAIRAEYADEEAEAAEAEIAERRAALDVPLNLRIDRDLDAGLKRQAAAAQIPTSALVRRILRQAIHETGAPTLTEEKVEEIARRVVAESRDA
jgi:predicted HicB family RNase H-like nuclease